jgi:hypothetical protein
MKRLLRPRFSEVCNLLNSFDVKYLVAGGFAAILHGLPRTTVDIDIFVESSRENVEKLLKALSNIGFGIAKEIKPEEILNKHVFLFADQVRIEIFIKLWGVSSFKDAYKRKEVIEYEGVRIPVLSLQDLIKSKDTDRPQDREDLVALKKIAERKLKNEKS